MKNQKGITITSLTVTIAVLLIIVGISITVVVNNGLIEATQEAKNIYEEADKAEQEFESELKNYKYGNYATSTDGTLILEDSDKLLTTNYRIYGKSIQDTTTSGTPSPDNQVEIQSVGELVTEGEHVGEYKIPITVTGKNLFNMEETLHNGILQENKITSNTGSTNIDFYLEAGTYSIAFKKDFESSIFFRKGQVSSGYFSSSTGKTHFSKFTFEEDGYLRISHFNNGGSIYDIMLVKEIHTKDTMPEYQPYKEVKTSIYLKEPLRQIGDSLEYADYVDFKNQKVVRKVGSYTFKGDEAMSLGNWRPSETTYGCAYPYSLIPCVREATYSEESKLLCTHLEKKPYNVVYNYTEGISSFISNTYGIFMVVSKNIATDSTSFKSWLSTQYSNGAPLIVDYALETPIQYDIDLSDIPLFEGYNNITINTNIAPSRIEINY